MGFYRVGVRAEASNILVPHQHENNQHLTVRRPAHKRRPYMPTSPKKLEEKMERMLNTWRTLAPDKSFGGMTLAQFEAAAAPSQTARQKILNFNAQRINAITERMAADEVFAAQMQQVVNGVLADPTFGPDSALYEAFGYTRTSERKSGLTRGRKEPLAK